MIRKAAPYFWGFLLFGLLVAWPFSLDKDLAKTGFGKRRKTGEDLYKSMQTDANFGLMGVKFFESTEGRKRWQINSKFAELHQSESYAFLREVDTNFFAEKTGNVVVTKSDYGKSMIDEQKVDLEGNVTIRSRRGYLFEMDRLTYSGKSHEFQTDDMVRMKGPSTAKPAMYLKGTGLHANIDDEHFILKKNVSARKLLKSSEWLRILSRSGEFFTEDQRAIFIGKVRSNMPKMSIDSDIFEISIDNDTESLFARGNVSLKSRGRIGRAETAMLEVGGTQIILEGHARIDSADNQLQGRRITLYTNDDRVEVDEAEGSGSQ